MNVVNCSNRQPVLFSESLCICLIGYLMVLVHFIVIDVSLIEWYQCDINDIIQLYQNNSYILSTIFPINQHQSSNTWCWSIYLHLPQNGPVMSGMQVYIPAQWSIWDVTLWMEEI